MTLFGTDWQLSSTHLYAVSEQPYVSSIGLTFTPAYTPPMIAQPLMIVPFGCRAEATGYPGATGESATTSSYHSKTTKVSSKSGSG